MNYADVTPETLARMRGDGTVVRCLDCSFVGIGAPASWHTRLHDGHRLVTEAAYAAAHCDSCGACTADGEICHDYCQHSDVFAGGPHA